MRLFPAIFFLLISALLVFSWFRFGLVYGGGDVGLPTYDPIRILDVTKYIWWESAAPGYPLPHGLTSTILMGGLSVLQFLGFSPLFLQASLFFILLFLMGFGMYLFASSIFGKEKKIYPLLAAIFYLFNPYMLIQIWHRFIHTSIVFVAFLPFFALFWRLWIKTSKPKFLALFLLTNLFGAYLYGTIAFVLTIWILLFLMTFLESLIPWRGFNLFLRNGLLFIIGLVLWVLMNSWWLIPTFSVGPALFSEQHSSAESTVTLLEISRQEVLPNAIQMINPFYLYEQAELGNIYTNFFFRLLPWIFVGIIFLGLLKTFLDKKLIHFGLLYLVVLFLSKGAASPFGYPFLLGFNTLFIFGVFRNPFEKLGILLPLFASILLVVGLRSLNKKIYLILLPITIVIFAWPLFWGTIFGRIEKPAFIKVPKSYKQADQWLKSQKKDGKLLHLPLPLGEAVSYNWEYGYNGVEPSSLLFTSNPSISRGFNIEIIDKALKQLSLAFHPQEAENLAKIIDLLQIFNVRFIIIHKDIKWAEQKLDDPNEVEKVLNKLFFLERRAEFGDLIIYEFPEKYYQPKVIIADNISLVSPAKNAPLIWQWLTTSATISLMTNEDMDQILSSHSKEIIIFPTNNFFFPENSKAALNDSLNKLFLSPNSPSNSPLIELLNYKNYLDVIGGNLSVKSVAEEIITASQDLIRMYQLAPNNQISSLTPIIKDYTKSINEVFVNKADEFSLYAFLKDPSEIFQSHLLLILYIQPILNDQQKEEINKSIDQIRVFLKNKNSLTTYPLLGSNEEGTKRQILTFWIPKGGKYELYMVNPQVQKEFIFQINDQVISLKGEESNNFLFFGELDFKEGLAEVSLVNSPLHEIFLRRVIQTDTQSSGQVISLEAKSPISYEGVVSLKRGAFIFFKETYHPGWKLELTKGNEVQKIDKHYLANMYGNGWFIERPGEYEFKLEFEPQNKVTTGFYLTATGWVGIILLWIGVKLKKRKESI